MLKFLAVGRLAKEGSQFAAGRHTIIAQHLTKSSDPSSKNYKMHVKQIMDKGSHKLKPGKRLRLTSEDDDYDLHVMADLVDGDPDQVIIFFAVTDPSFGQVHSVANLFDEFKSEFISVNTTSDIMRTSGGGQVDSQSKTFLTRLGTKYGNNKLEQVQNQVEEVKGVMQQNVQIALQNVDNLQDMEIKSDKFASQAKQFEKGSTNLKKMMRCRYYKMNAIIAVFVIAIVLLIILQFLPAGGDSGSSSSNNNNNP